MDLDAGRTRPGSSTFLHGIRMVIAVTHYISPMPDGLETLDRVVAADQGGADPQSGLTMP